MGFIIANLANLGQLTRDCLLWFSLQIAARTDKLEIEIVLNRFLYR